MTETVLIPNEEDFGFMEEGAGKDDGGPVCTKGWARRCADSKGTKCTCGCGGKNHGKKKNGESTSNQPLSDHNGTIRGIWDTREVLVCGKRLLPAESWKYRNHNPDGFNWGYGGSGPAQLALALLLYFVSPDLACAIYQQFKWDVIARLPQWDFELLITTVVEWLKRNVEYGRGAACAAQAGGVL